MKTSVYRRIRHRAHTSENARSKKEGQQEQCFFGENTHDPFFKNSNGLTTQPAMQLKSFGSENDAASIQRIEDKKDEEKKVQRKQEEEREEVQKNAVDKEDVQMKPMDKEEERDKEDKKLQRKEASATASPTSANYIHSLNGKGNPLPANANAFFSSRMGYDFSEVKVHTDKEAADSAKDLNAKAYTMKNNIVFNEGQFNTDSSVGKKLLAHELTHVLQQSSENQLKRKAIPDENEKERVVIPTFSQRGIVEQNTRHFANCNGVSVEGHTDANYGNSFTAPGTSTPVTDCPDCESDECVVNRGTVISVFTTNPQITLPSVPSGLNRCEQNAVRNFINTTLRAHERQHVAAFNTYRGRVRTPYTYRGCASGLDTYLQQIHDRIEAARKANSDAASAALDAGGANIFNVNCDCPDPDSASSGK